MNSFLPGICGGEAKVRLKGQAGLKREARIRETLRYLGRHSKELRPEVLLHQDVKKGTTEKEVGF